MTTEFKAGRAYIEVGPSLKGFRRKTEADLKTELATAGTKAGEQLGENIAEGAEKGAAKGGRRSADQFAGEFDKQVRTRIKAALKSLPEAQIGASTSEAEQKIRDLREKLLDLSSKRIGIDVDAAQALSELETIRREMDTIDGQQLTLDARINTAAAMAELDRLKVKADLVDGDDININVDVDTGAAHANLTALQAHAASTALSISSIGLAIAALGPALIPLAAGGTVALAGLGGAAVGAAGGVGVLGAALAPVVGAVQALSAADSQSAATARQSAKARETAAARTEAAEQRVSDAVRSVRDAEESAARAVSDAQERLAQVREQSASRIQSALRSVGDAEARLADAQRASLTAQQAINDARNEARRTLQDLALELKSAQLQERGASLSIAEAQDALNRAMRDPKSSRLERERAQLALEQAQQSLKEIQLRTKRLADEKKSADKKGVEGSDAVTKAQQAAKDAADNVLGAERDLADARAAAAKAERDGARDISKAVRDVSRAQADGAKQVEAAQRSLARAQEAYRESLRQTGDVGSAAMDKVDQAMENLTPTGQRFARWVYSLKDALVDVSKIAQDGFLPGLMDGLQKLGIYGDGFKRTIGDIAGVLGDLARDSGKALAGPFWQQFFKFLGAKTPKWLDTLGRTLGAGATGLAALFQAFAPIIDMMGGGTLSTLERFSAWAQGLGKNQGFQRFLAYLEQTGPKVAAFLSAFARALGNIVVGLAPFGTGVMDALTAGLDWIAKLDPNQIGAVATSLLAIAGGLKAISVVQGLVTGAAALGPWGLLAGAIAAVAGVIFYLYQTNADFKKKIDVLWGQIVDIFNGAVAALQKFWHDHGEQIRAEWDQIWGWIEDTFSSVWKSIQDIAKSVGGWLQLFWKEWGDRLQATFGEAWQGIRSIIDGALQVIRGIFETFAGLFTGDWSRMWNGLTEVFNGAAKALWGALRTAFAVIRQTIDLALAAISSAWSRTWGLLVDGFSQVWNGLVDAIRGPIDRVLQFIQENLIDKINGLFELLGLKLHISPVWTPSVTDTAYKGSRAKNQKRLGFREGGYTGNKGINQIAGVVHGREFVMDASTTALAGGQAAMEAIRDAIRSGWKPVGYKQGGYVNPVGRRPSFPWGRYPSGGRHPAFDYAVPIGTRVVSPYSGTVIRDGWDTTGYGTSIRGRSDDGIFFVLGHLLRELVSPGQHVRAGELVGYSGNSGNSTGPHLHFGTSHTPNMVGSGAFNPDLGGGTPGGIGAGLSGIAGFFSNFAANAISDGINGFVNVVAGGLSRFGLWGDLLGGVVRSLGTGASNLGLTLLGLDSGGQTPGTEGVRDPRPLLFDAGGWLPTGISLVKNATGRPEPLMRMNTPQALGMGPALDLDELAAVLVDALGAARFEVAMSNRTAGAVVQVGTAHNGRMGRRR